MTKIVDALILAVAIPLLLIFAPIAFVVFLWDAWFNGSEGVAKEWHRGVKI